MTKMDTERPTSNVELGKDELAEMNVQHRLRLVEPTPRRELSTSNVERGRDEETGEGGLGDGGILLRFASLGLRFQLRPHRSYGQVGGLGEGVIGRPGDGVRDQLSNKNSGAGIPTTSSSRKKVFLVTKTPLPKLRFMVV